MTNTHLKNLFDFLKSLGHFKEFSSYAEYREKKFGIYPVRKKEDFKKTLSKTEKEQFEFLFNDEENA